MDIEKSAVTVLSGGRYPININMGSCQCGSHRGSVYLKDGVVWATCDGRMRWQQYDGPAADCGVGYGFGSAARKIAACIAKQDARQEILLESA